MEHGSDQRWLKGVHLSHDPLPRTKSPQPLSIANPLERAWVRGSSLS